MVLIDTTRGDERPRITLIGSIECCGGVLGEMDDRFINGKELHLDALSLSSLFLPSVRPNSDIYSKV